MKTKYLFAWLVAMLFALPSHAGDGHDHGDAAPSAAAGPALPRFSAVSELFELVGIVDGKKLTVFLDRFEDNAPVQGAKLELDLGGAKVALEEHEPGLFEGTLAEEPKPGVIAVTATVSTAKDTDLLAGELDVHEHEHAETTGTRSWRDFAPWVLALAVAAGVAGWAVKRKAGGAA
jgi:hypothetical protein